METVTNNSIIKGIAKKYHLTFCPKYKYYEGNAYNNDKGETLPTYFCYGAKIYELKYFSGCFNPFLVDVTKKINDKINDAYSRHFTAKNEEDKARALKYAEYLENLFKA